MGVVHSIFLVTGQGDDGHAPSLCPLSYFWSRAFYICNTCLMETEHMRNALIVITSLKVRQVGPFLIIEEELIATVIETEPDEASQ